MKVRWPESLKLPPQGEIEDRLWHHLNARSGPVESKVLYDLLAEDFHLTPQQRTARAPNSTESAWNYHVRWAKQKLVSRRWIDVPKNGLWVLTEAGRKKEIGPALEDL
jgi:restriction endonuclease Mrr